MLDLRLPLVFFLAFFSNRFAFCFGARSTVDLTPFFVRVLFAFTFVFASALVLGVVFGGKKNNAIPADGGTAAAGRGDGIAEIRPEHRPLPPALR